MPAAWLITVLALCGIFIGALLGQSRGPTSQLAAAGGGLLFGICVFWLVPEIAETSGWFGAIGLAIAVGGGLVLLDRYLVHIGRSPRHGVVGPLLAATAVHSFLDGWSVRALSIQPLANVAVPIGLALHKLPEGLALGWVSRRSFQNTSTAVLAACGVEMLTIAGAWVEPHAERSGSETFGPWWTAVVLAIVAGSFLFLGFHTVVPERKNAGVTPIFVGTFLIVGALAFLKFPR
jgi:zinc transporter ZupT